MSGNFSKEKIIQNLKETLRFYQNDTNINPVEVVREIYNENIALKRQIQDLFNIMLPGDCDEFVIVPKEWLNNLTKKFSRISEICMNQIDTLLPSAKTLSLPQAKMCCSLFDIQSIDVFELKEVSKKINQSIKDISLHMETLDAVLETANAMKSTLADENTQLYAQLEKTQSELNLFKANESPSTGITSPMIDWSREVQAHVHTLQQLYETRIDELNEEVLNLKKELSLAFTNGRQTTSNEINYPMSSNRNSFKFPPTESFINSFNHNRNNVFENTAALTLLKNSLQSKL
eukprot:TRINITY_DN1562_c0_g1_i1.p1 TRINITY_DN1562_c0_g1~~TRINITY_DN1562_c0_g1_i1.p1  ORF type:complete len:290 (-),score=86.62 TRINITY_DN1562_c0_g1_i1:108-977(-)